MVHPVSAALIRIREPADCVFGLVGEEVLPVQRIIVPGQQRWL